MTISVILCTYNRGASLRQALESVAASKMPGLTDWEVLVVDNNSSDQTRLVAEEYCSRYPGRFRYLFESTPGKSHALNAGIREARGEILAFMDDDVTVEPQWLQNLTAALHDGPWAGAGGRICLDQNSSAPRWVRLEGPYSMGGPVAALFDEGDVPCQLDCPPFGTNMAFRRTMFEKYGGFRLDLGPRPGSEIRSEDTEFGQRLLTAGERLWYAPSAVVYHPAKQERLTKSFLLNYWFSIGRTAVRQRGYQPGPLGIPRYCLSFGMLLFNSLRWIATIDPARRFFWKCWTWMYAGKVVENYRQAQQGKRDPAPTYGKS